MKKLKIFESSGAPMVGKTITIEGDSKHKILAVYHNASGAAEYEKKEGITDDDGYAVTARIASGELEKDEKGLFVYIDVDGKPKLTDLTDGEVEYTVE